MTYEIRNQHDERIDYTFGDGGRGDDEIVVIGHGVTGNKDRPFLVELSEGLIRSGISSLRISFSGNGNSEGKFEESTISKEVDDLGAVIDALEGRRVIYVGHSMGGAVGVIRAARDTRITKLVSLAGMVHTHEFARREFGVVVPGSGCMWENSECPLSREFMSDMEGIGSVEDLGVQIRIPWLMVHGSDDDVVPIQDSKDIRAKSNDTATLHEIVGADHVFSGEHASAMTAKVVDWLQTSQA